MLCILTHTHTHMDSLSLSCPSHNSPIGALSSRKRDKWEMSKTERCESAAWTLQSCLLLNLLCVDVLSPGLSACLNCLPSCLSVRARACARFDSILVCQESVPPETSSEPPLFSEVSECCFLQTKWWHPVCDSDRPHRFTVDRADSAGLVIQTEHSENKRNGRIVMILVH